MQELFVFTPIYMKFFSHEAVLAIDKLMSQHIEHKNMNQVKQQNNPYECLTGQNLQLDMLILSQTHRNSNSFAFFDKAWLY